MKPENKPTSIFNISNINCGITKVLDIFPDSIPETLIEKLQPDYKDTDQSMPIHMYSLDEIEAHHINHEDTEEEIEILNSIARKMEEMEANFVRFIY